MDDARTQISRLVHEYAHRIDAGDFAGVADLLARAVVKASGRMIADRDRAAVLKMYETSTRRYEDGTPHTKHLVTNLEIQVDGAAATARSYFSVLQALPDFPLQTIIAGRYADRFGLFGDDWHFTERDIVAELYGDLSRHLFFDPRPR